MPMAGALVTLRFLLANLQNFLIINALSHLVGVIPAKILVLIVYDFYRNVAIHV